MNAVHWFRELNFRQIAGCLACALGATSVAGCSANESHGSVGEPRSGNPELISGEPAAADQYRSTVAIGDSCTAAKVGPKLFLTAAHCVAVGRPIHGMPPPENFPPNDGVLDSYLPDAPLLIHWGLDVNDGLSASFTIAHTSIHPSWWACPLCEDPVKQTGAADIAVIEINEDTPQIPEARVELSNVPTGTQVVKVGWGCEERTNVDAGDVHLGRYKVANASIIPVYEIRPYEPRISDDDAAAIDAAYLMTAGHDKDESSASLCLGDSGGPLYLAGSADLRIVGVNSDYSFKPAEPPALGGVSWVDWHTRTSLSSGNAVGQWLRDLKVSTVSGH